MVKMMEHSYVNTMIQNMSGKFMEIIELDKWLYSIIIMVVGVPGAKSLII